MIVVDASAAFEVLTNGKAAPLIAAALAARAPAIAPVHFDVEVYAALRRTYLRQRADRARLLSAVDRLAQLDAERIEIQSLLPNVVGLADVIGAHDVFYVLLSISRACPLLTCDLRLARAAARLGVEVIAVQP